MIVEVFNEKTVKGTIIRTKNNDLDRVLDTPKIVLRGTNNGTECESAASVLLIDLSDAGSKYDDSTTTVKTGLILECHLTRR